MASTNFVGTNETCIGLTNQKPIVNLIKPYTMKNFVNVAKFVALMLLFTFSFSHTAYAQRYLSERVSTSYSSSIKEGTSNLHTFSNGLKLAVLKKGADEKLVVIDETGAVIVPSSTTQLTPMRLSINIKTKRCTIKVVLDRSNPDRRIDGDISCDVSN